MANISPGAHLLPLAFITLKRKRSQNFTNRPENLLPRGTLFWDQFRGLLGPIPGAHFGPSGPATVWGRPAPPRAEVGEGGVPGGNFGTTGWKKMAPAQNAILPSPCLLPSEPISLLNGMFLSWHRPFGNPARL